jgi:hypothetical protein
VTIASRAAETGQGTRLPPPGGPSGAPEATSPWRAGLKRTLPWALGICLLLLAARSVPPRSILNALLQARWAVLAPTVLLGFVLLWAAEALALRITFGQLGAALALRDLFLLRGASQLLAVVNYAAGQGGLAYWVHRRSGLALARTVVGVLLTSAATLTTVLVAAAVGIFLSGDERLKPLGPVLLAALGLGVVYLTLLRVAPARWSRWSVGETLVGVGVGGHLRLTLARVPHVLLLLTIHTIALWAFGIVPGLGRALVYLPALFVVAALPLTPLGLGSTQALAVALLSPFATTAWGPAAAGTAHAAGGASGRAAVLAYTVGVQLSFLTLQLLAGALCWRALSHPDTKAGAKRSEVM